jgi:NADPH:quinone reductase-like Zn-dependent oxidoreductase
LQIVRTAIFEKRGFANFKIKDDVGNPKVLDYDVLIKVIVAAVNPIDYYVISGYKTIQQQKETDQL